MEKVATEDRKLKKMIESIYAEHEQKKLILAKQINNRILRMIVKNLFDDAPAVFK